MHRRTALLAVVVSAACFATLAIFTRLAYDEGARPLPLLAWRFALVTVLMAVYLLIRSPRALVDGFADLPRYAALSVTGYGAASIGFFFALEHASASVVAVVLYTYPAMVAVLGRVFLGEPLTRARLGAILVTFAGCALVAGLAEQRVEVDTLGVLLALGAALGYSIFNLVSYKVVGRRGRLVPMTYTFGISALFVAGIALVAGEELAPVGWSPGLWLLLVAIVIVPTFVAVVLYLRGVRGLGAPQAAIVSTTEPLFTIALAALVLGDRLAATQWLGAALVVAGVVAAEWPASRVTDELAVV